MPIMMNPDFLEKIVRQVMRSLPGGDSQLRQDLEKNLHAAMQGVFSRMDLVTREEFEVQRDLLARSRTKLEQLEKQIAQLEAQLKQNPET